MRTVHAYTLALGVLTHAHTRPYEHSSLAAMSLRAVSGTKAVVFDGGRRVGGRIGKAARFHDPRFCMPAHAGARARAPRSLSLSLSITLPHARAVTPMRFDRV